jgi:hypothetical protein
MRQFSFRTLLLFLLLTLALANTASAQVLTEKATDLGNGFKAIETGQINVPGRWYSDKKFHFLYFEKRRLCQCTQYVLSPSGKRIIFQESSNKEIIAFDADKNKTQLFNKLPASELKEVKWSKNEKTAELSLLLKTADKESQIVRRVKIP